MVTVCCQGPLPEACSGEGGVGTGGEAEATAGPRVVGLAPGHKPGSGIVYTRAGSPWAHPGPPRGPQIAW